MASNENSAEISQGRPSARAALVLAALLLALRLPFLNHPTPVHPDETEFINGLGFPRPYPVHQPGYLLWVASGTAAARAGFEPYEAYQVWSVLGSVAAPILFYLGASRWICAEKVAWWLALAFGVNPLVWFTATTALNYVPALAGALAVILLCARCLHTRAAGDAILASSALAITGWLRPDLIVWLGPLLAVAAIRAGRRALVGAAAVLLAGVAVLLVATAWIYGRSPDSGLSPTVAHTEHVILQTSVFYLGPIDGLVRNAVKLIMNLGWDFGLGTLLLIPAVYWCARRRRVRPGVAVVLLLWSAPLLVFLLLIHMSEPGHAALLIPAGYGAIGLGVQCRFRPRVAARLAALVAIASTAQFLLYPWSSAARLPGERPWSPPALKRLLDAKITYMSAIGLRQIDRRPLIHAPGDFWPTAAHDEPGGSALPEPEPSRGKAR